VICSLILNMNPEEERNLHHCALFFNFLGLVIVLSTFGVGIAILQDRIGVDLVDALILVLL
jgi:hypothetical protein